MKKVLALVLAVVLAFGMATTGFAKAGDRIEGVNDPLGLSNVTPIDGMTIGDVSGSSIDGVIATHNVGMKIWLDTGMFSWKNSSVPTDSMTLSNLTSLTVKASWKKGGEYFNSPELKYDSKLKTCFIELKTKKGITVTSDKDIDGKIVLSYKSTKTEIAISGLASNSEDTVSDGDESAWVTSNTYIKANDFIKNLEFNFESDDVIAYANVFGGKKYYLWIEEDVQSSDEEIIAKYDSIEAVYHAYYSSNVNTPSTYVSFDIDDKYYVYNKDGVYIGLSSEKLALSGVYYLSTKKIDNFGDAGATEEPGDAPAGEAPAPANPPMGGDDVAPNANDNPGTGANGLVNVAVVAGLVALAAVGAVSKK